MALESAPMHEMQPAPALGILDVGKFAAKPQPANLDFAIFGRFFSRSLFEFLNIFE